MTVYFSYVGRLEGNDFQWDNPPPSTTASNLPPRLVPENALFNIGVNIFWAIDQAKLGQYETKQLDWGAWGVMMTGSQLCAFFGPDHEYADALAALTADETYVLVAGER